MLFLHFIIQVFHKNYNVLWIGGSLDRVVHDAPVKLYQICLSFYTNTKVGFVSSNYFIYLSWWPIQDDILRYSIILEMALIHVICRRLCQDGRVLVLLEPLFPGTFLLCFLLGRYLLKLSVITDINNDNDQTFILRS